MMNRMLFIPFSACLLLPITPESSSSPCGATVSSREAKPDRSSLCSSIWSVSTSRSRGETSFSFCRAAVVEQNPAQVPVHQSQHGDSTSMRGRIAFIHGICRSSASGCWC
ncbi:hypothetical protein V8C35DRAFT_312455 [Trichoderma chlorosporum]